MVHWFDLTVGELLGLLETAGHRDDTLVIYVVDNGWLPPAEGQGRFDSRAKMSPYDAGMRTPVVLRWPGVIRPERDIESLVSTVDIVPTILAATQAESSADLPGIDLLDRERIASRETVFGALFAHTSVDINDPQANLKYRYVVRKDGWKLIRPYRPNRDVELMINGDKPWWMQQEDELYNVLEDPEETLDLSGSQPALQVDLAAAIDAWWPVDS